MSSQVPSPSSTTFTNLLAPAAGVPPAVLPSQPSSEPLPSAAFVGMHFPNVIAAQYGSHPQVTNILSSTHHSRIQPPRTRNKKASTMSAKKWRPAENRIKELWVGEEETLEALRDMVNSEFGFTANDRQYKSQIKRMKLEKNVKEDERKAIARHLKYRERKAKKTKYIRVRGHEITQAKRIRWRNDYMSPSPLSSPPPLPSYINILTGSLSGSPTALPHTLSPNQQAKVRPFSPMDGFNQAIQRLFAYANDESVKSQEASPIFSALQLILGCERQKPPRKHYESWDAVTEEYITLFRNPSINITQKIALHREWNRVHEDGLEFQYKWNRGPSGGCDRHAIWWTAYGMIQFSFKTVSNASHHRSPHQEDLQSMDEVPATRITFIPIRTPSTSFVAVFDFNPRHDPFARITYQAMIPNQSRIFQVVSAGDVNGLILMLEEGSGRLTDRDEEGRSLLNYSLQNSMVGMSKFLLQKHQDPNALELDDGGLIGPLHVLNFQLHSVVPAERRNRVAECHKLLLDSGADYSLLGYQGMSWWSSFQYAIQTSSKETLEHILNFGGPFVSPNTGVSDTSSNERSALLLLAELCGYIFRNTIHIVDKALLLLKGKADIACQDFHGNTVLHTLLSCERMHEERHFYAQSFYLSLTEPRQLLIVFLSAGADVYAVNQKGETPSSVAKQYGREDEWIEALIACGYNHEEILARSELGFFGHSETRQSGQLSFEDVCRQRQEYLKFKTRFFEECCRKCGDKFDPTMISFEEECSKCGQEFRYKEESLDNRYQPLLEQYLRDKDKWTQYYQRRQQSLHDERLRFKKTYFEERCRDCGGQFQPEPEYSPERCLQCGARIRPRGGQMEACFGQCLSEYFHDKRRYRLAMMLAPRLDQTLDQRLAQRLDQRLAQTLAQMLAPRLAPRLAHGRRHSNIDEDYTTDWSWDGQTDYDEDSNYNSDSDRDNASSEASETKINHHDFTTHNAEMADPNLAKGPRNEQSQMSFQALDPCDVGVDTSLEERELGWVPSLMEAPTDSRILNAVVAEVAAEEVVFQTPSIPANDETLAFHSPISADLDVFKDFFDIDMYCGDT